MFSDREYISETRVVVDIVVDIVVDVGVGAVVARPSVPHIGWRGQRPAASRYPQALSRRSSLGSIADPSTTTTTTTVPALSLIPPPPPTSGCFQVRCSESESV